MCPFKEVGPFYPGNHVSLGEDDLTIFEIRWSNRRLTFLIKNLFNPFNVVDQIWIINLVI
jgi:hypothetical protein